MSLLSSVAKIGLLPSAFIAKQISKVINPNSNLAKLPTGTIAAEGAKTTVGKIIGGSAVGVAGAIGAAYAPVGSVGTALKSLIPKTVTGKVIAAGTVGVIAQSEVLRKGVSTADPIAFTGDIANIIDNPSGGSIATLFKNNPLITTIVGGAAAVAVGKSVIPAIATIGQTQATRGLTEAVQNATLPTTTIQEVTPQTSSSSPMAVNSANGEALTTDTSGINLPQTESLTPKKRAKRSSRRRVQPSVRQSVRVNVVNTRIGTTTKRYLNTVVVPNV